MICKKCSRESETGSKFCSQCGAELEELSRLDNLIQNCQRMWYILGLLRGRSIDDKENKWHTDFENQIKEKIPELYKEYEEVIQFWEDFAAENLKS